MAHGCLQIPTPNSLMLYYHEKHREEGQTFVPKALGSDVQNFKSTEQTRHTPDLCIPGITQGKVFRVREQTLVSN